MPKKIPTIFVAKIKAYLSAGFTDTEIGDAFRVHRNSIHAIRAGQTYPRVRPLRSVPEDIAKVAEEIAADEREVVRLAEVERRRVLKENREAREAFVNADPDVQAATKRLADLTRRSKLALSPADREALRSDLAEVNKEGKDALERARARAPGAP